MKPVIAFGFVFLAVVFQIYAQEQKSDGLTEAEKQAVDARIDHLMMELGNEEYLAREKASNDFLDWLARTETISRLDAQDDQDRLKKSRRTEIRFKIQAALENAERENPDIEIQWRAKRVLDAFESLKKGEEYGIVIADDEDIENFRAFSTQVNNLMEVLKNPNFSSVEQYNKHDFGIMVKNGPRVLPILSAALLQNNPDQFRSIADLKMIDILGRIGKPAIETLTKVLENGKEFSNVRKVAGAELVQIGKKIGAEEEIARIFIQFVDAAKLEPVSETRRWAVLEMGKLGNEAVIQKLIFLVDENNESNFDVRCCAVTALRLYGDITAEPALEKIISSNRYQYLREEARKALDDIRKRSNK